MVKKILSLRLEEDLVDRYRAEAEKNSKSITDYVTEKLTNQLFGTMQEKQNLVLMAENKRLSEQLTKLTGKAPKRDHTIQVKVTAEQHFQWKTYTRKLGVSSSELFRQMLSKPQMALK